MKHFASRRFWQCFERLPVTVQQLARRNFRLLKTDSEYPSLHFKKIGRSDLWSVRVGLHYRALGISVDAGVQWFWIGTHEQYNRLVR